MLYVTVLSNKILSIYQSKYVQFQFVAGIHYLLKSAGRYLGSWMRIVSQKQVDFVNELFMFQLTKPIQTLSAIKWINGNHFLWVKEKANENGIAEG